MNAEHRECEVEMKQETASIAADAHAQLSLLLKV